MYFILHFMQFVSIYASYLYDSVILYATALNELLKRETMLTDKLIEEVANNGTKIVETIIGLGSYKSEFLFPALLSKC